MANVMSVLAAIVTVALVLFSFQNMQTMLFQLFGQSLEISVGVACLLYLAWGAATMALVFQKKALKQQGIQSDWQAQDAKLIASVKSDREKQLEAKISTLETALKTALKQK